MIIPIGHEESEVRRWPWVSFAIMALCLLALLATNGEANDPKWLENAVSLEDAASFWRDHAYLDASPEVRSKVSYDAPPNQREAYLAMLQDQALAWTPDDPDELARDLQQRFPQAAILRVLHHRPVRGRVQRDLPPFSRILVRRFFRRLEHVLRNPS